MIERFESESRYAPVIGFSKAVRAGSLVFVAGMTAIDAAGEVAHQVGVPPAPDPRQPVAVTGARRHQRVVPAHWEQVGRAHGETFADHRPAATMVVVKELLEPRMLVEIEVVAVVV